MNAPKSLDFHGTKINGIVTRFLVPPFELHPYETHFAGVKGISRIKGGTGKRLIEVDLTLFNNFKDRTALRKFIDDKLNWELVDETDTLTYSTDNPRFSAIYPDCTFLGFTPIGSHLPDVAGTLDGGWFCDGTLRFEQLSHDG